MTSYDIMNQFWNWRYVLKSRFSQSLLNYVPFMPTCFACLRAYVPCVSMPLMCLRVFVPQVTTWLRGYVPLFITCLSAFFFHVPTCLRAYKYYFMPSCLCTLKYFMPTCAHVLTFTCLGAYNNSKYTEAHFYTLRCCFSLDYLTFHSIQNPKTTSCF